MTTLPQLSLSRATLDRASRLRPDPGLLPGLLAVPATAVLLLAGDRALISDGAQGPKLELLDPQAARRLADPEDALLAFLGEDEQGRGYLLLAGPAGSDDPPSANGVGPGRKAAGGRNAAPGRRTVAGARNGVPGAVIELPDPQRQRWADLRSVGDLLDDTDAGLMTSAVALANWHASHPHCARCGAATVPSQAGWARLCPDCGAEHYPRTDPAVIMAVVDADDRILLGRQARWPDRRFSTLAGFVESGESLESAVRREVAEESGVQVGAVSYRGSQPWPFPASLMLGFRAEATSTRITVDGHELSQAQWWTREELGLDVATGELLLPPRISIARRLIEEWFGGPIAAGQDAGR